MGLVAKPPHLMYHRNFCDKNGSFPKLHRPRTTFWLHRAFLALNPYHFSVNDFSENGIWNLSSKISRNRSSMKLVVLAFDRHGVSSIRPLVGMALNHLLHLIRSTRKDFFHEIKQVMELSFAVVWSVLWSLFGTLGRCFLVGGHGESWSD